MGEQIEEERVSGMSKNIIDGLRYAYEAYCRGDSEEAVDAIDVDPNILWIEPKEFYAGGTYRGREARHRLPHARVCGDRAGAECAGRDPGRRRQDCGVLTFPSLAQGRW